MFGLTSKSIFLSKTIWGLLIAVLAEVLKAHGVSVDQAGLVNDAITAIGTGVAIYGRFTASKTLHVIPPKAPAP